MAKFKCTVGILPQENPLDHGDVRLDSLEKKFDLSRDDRNAFVERKTSGRGNDAIAQQLDSIAIGTHGAEARVVASRIDSQNDLAAVFLGLRKFRHGPFNLGGCLISSGNKFEKAPERCDNF